MRFPCLPDGGIVASSFSEGANPDLLTAGERTQYERHLRREDTSAAILLRRASP